MSKQVGMTLEEIKAEMMLGRSFSIRHNGGEADPLFRGMQLPLTMEWIDQQCHADVLLKLANEATQ